MLEKTRAKNQIITERTRTTYGQKKATEGINRLQSWKRHYQVAKGEVTEGGRNSGIRAGL